MVNSWRSSKLLVKEIYIFTRVYYIKFKFGKLNLSLISTLKQNLDSCYNSKNLDKNSYNIIQSKKLSQHTKQRKTVI